MLGGRSVGRIIINYGGKQHGLRIFSVTAHGFYRAVLPLTLQEQRLILRVFRDGRLFVTTRNLLTIHPRTPCLHSLYINNLKQLAKL